eukprot:932168-Karenia_brevis.AAC.1
MGLATLAAPQVGAPLVLREGLCVFACRCCRVLFNSQWAARPAHCCAHSTRCRCCHMRPTLIMMMVRTGGRHTESHTTLVRARA